ncbi:DUF262 domain-containing protein [Amycolatopsis sp. A133]|uniref:DUF262 domain-containing protein n=1 Tax=Amycolatopsis sp. A133 TaxID=3064472 RepID=UPI0027EBDACC|nr:DUF262 domain-containing protein [Amycolatopsis sp. A133]MDQ7805874.1 DUF262 domain-containing protein [Amycolatopsis sp. A133]
MSLDVTEEDITSEVRQDSTVTWSTDWTVGTIIEQLRRDRFDLEPAFQRRDVWNQTKQSRFIESLLLGIPVPQLILAERNSARGKFIVLDGKQRLRSLQRFAGLDGPPLRLTGLDVLTNLRGATYEDFLDDNLEAHSAALENQSIRAVVLRGWANEALLYLTFLRLNSNVVGLSPQELRRALHPGKFMEYLMEHSGEDTHIQNFLNIKKPDFRMRDAEILLRHIALTLRIREYRGNLRAFLDETCSLFNSEWQSAEREVRQASEGFDRAAAFTSLIFGKEAFRRYSSRGYERPRNRAVLDIMAFYFQHPEIRRTLGEHRGSIKPLFEDLCRNNAEFSESLTSTTKSVGAVMTRLTYWGRALSELSPAVAEVIPG